MRLRTLSSPPPLCAYTPILNAVGRGEGFSLNHFSAASTRSVSETEALVSKLNQTKPPHARYEPVREQCALSPTPSPSALLQFLPRAHTKKTRSRARVRAQTSPPPPSSFPTFTIGSRRPLEPPLVLSSDWLRELPRWGRWPAIGRCEAEPFLPIGPRGPCISARERVVNAKRVLEKPRRRIESGASTGDQQRHRSSQQSASHPPFFFSFSCGFSVL